MADLDYSTLSEEYRISALEWVDKDGAARMLDESKSVVFSQLVSKQGDIPVSRAEHAVRSSDEWKEYIEKMVQARTEANSSKVEMRFREMRFMERQSTEATARAERRL